MKAENDHSEESSRRLDKAREEAELAEREVASGFPVLHAWAVVGLWAHLESLIRTFLVEWLKHKRSARTIEQIARVKVRLGEYENIPRSLLKKVSSGSFYPLLLSFHVQLVCTGAV